MILKIASQQRSFEVAHKIERLMDYEKIYYEPTYSRSDLARELNVPETMISRVINVHFKKIFSAIAQ